MAGWVFTGYPGGSQQLFAGDEFPFKQSPCKMVLHSTETDGYPQYARNKAPHVTANPGDRTWRQHRPLDKPSWSLAVGPVSTNSMGAIQIEIIGRAATLKDLNQASLDWLGGLIRYLMQQANIPMQSSVSFGGAETYGTNGTVRLSSAAWTGYRGILGHQHVPGNSHWDPGDLDGSVPFNQSRWFKAIAGTGSVESGEDDMKLMHSTNRGYAAVGAGYYYGIGSMAQVYALQKIWGASTPVTNEEFDIVRAASIQGDFGPRVADEIWGKILNKAESPDGTSAGPASAGDWLRSVTLNTEILKKGVKVDVDEGEISEALIDALNEKGLSISEEGLAEIVNALKNVTYQTKAV